MLPEEIFLLENFLKKNETLFIKQPTLQKKITFSPTIQIEEMGEEWLVCFLTQKEYVNDIYSKFIENKKYFLVDEITSPVLEFNRCFFDGSILNRGRIYFVKEFYDSENNLIKKDKNFIDFCNKVIRYIRNNFIKDKKSDDYLSPMAIKWIDENQSKWIPNQGFIRRPL